MKSMRENHINKTECAGDGCASCGVDLYSSADKAAGERKKTDWMKDLPRNKTLRLILGALLFTNLLILDLEPDLSLALYIVTYLILGFDVICRAFTWKGKNTFFDEHFLMTAATIGAFAIAEYPEAVAVMLFYQAGELLQGLAVGHSRRSIRALQAIRPDRVNLVTSEGVVEADPESVPAGAQIVIRPGERVPLDSLIIDGESELDTAALTGESLPRAAGPDDEILAGSINSTGKILARVLRPAADSAVSRILELVEQAAARKAAAEKFISRFAAVYTPLMIGLALVIGLVVPAVFQLSFTSWIYRALIILVVSCPCALVISVPLGYFAGLGVLSRKGLLVKGGTYIEQIARTKRIAFDKTGTLTAGEFSVEKVEPHLVSEEELLALAAAAEEHSHHPLASSLRRYYHQKTGMDIETGHLESYREYPGRGIIAVYRGRRLLAGNLRLMQEHSIDVPQSAGKNTGDGAVLHLAADSSYLGRIELADRLKPDIAKTIRSLREMNIDLLLLSGDRQESVEAAARQLGIDNFKFGLLPEDKVLVLEAWMRESQAEGSTIYIGDGINDAPVLTRADVGIAMGNGSDAATENADGVLISGDLGKLPEAIFLARKTATIIRQNVALAIGFKALILLMALFGLSSIWQAVFADVGVTLMAVLNSLRLLAKTK